MKKKSITIPIDISARSTWNENNTPLAPLKRGTIIITLFHFDRNAVKWRNLKNQSQDSSIPLSLHSEWKTRLHNVCMEVHTEIDCYASLCCARNDVQLIIAMKYEEAIYLIPIDISTRSTWNENKTPLTLSRGNITITLFHFDRNAVKWRNLKKQN